MPPSWAWIPIVIGAALAQTLRNTLQRSLTASAGTLGATLVRFLYGLPVAALWVGVLYWWPGSSYKVPSFTGGYFAWVLLGATAQIAATAFLLAAMKERNFIVAVTYSKTEVLQVAAFAALFLHELPSALVLAAIVMATVGVVMISMPRPKPGEPDGPTAWGGKAIFYGLASGAMFALSAVGYRGASLALGDTPAWLCGAWGVLWAQAMQSVMLGGWIAVRSPQTLGVIFRAWRVSTLAGAAGAIASIGWFTAFALQTAAQVRALGMIEVLFSYLVSRRLLKEKLGISEQVGLALVAVGLVVVCAGI